MELCVPAAEEDLRRTEVRTEKEQDAKAGIFRKMGKLSHEMLREKRSGEAERRERLLQKQQHRAALRRRNAAGLYRPRKDKQDIEKQEQRQKNCGGWSLFRMKGSTHKRHL